MFMCDITIGTICFLKVCFGVNLRGVLSLSLEMYLQNVLERFKMQISKPISATIEKNHRPNHQDCP